MQAGFLLYGATGHTGELMARAAIQRGLRPILAGRKTAALKKIADELSPIEWEMSMPNPPFTHSNSGSLHAHDRRPEQGYERGYESRYRANHDDTQPSAVYQEPSYPPQEMPFQYQR